MNNPRGFKQKLTAISRLWKAGSYAVALSEVETVLKTWPGNAHLHVLWASLVQLQEESEHGLDEVKQALQQAIELDGDSPAAMIELGHYLDTVEDDPPAAAKAYAKGVAAARQLLIDGLIGQAKVFRQLDNREEFLRCLLEVLHLTRSDPDVKRAKVEESGTDIIFESPAGHFHAVQLNGPYAGQIQDLLSEGVPER